VAAIPTSAPRRDSDHDRVEPRREARAHRDDALPRDKPPDQRISTL
jgi:hypothetical protein